MAATLSRRAYAAMYGPTAGDRVRLADTELFVEVERDLTTYGEEVKFGGGKVIRDGMGQSQATRAQGAVDTVVTNALILDHTGIYKADIGLRDGRIHAIGKAGNPDTQPGVDIVIGPGTEAIAGEGRIVTAGGFDAHIHYICPQQIDDALHSGVTTMLGGGTGPAHGTFGHDLHARTMAYRPDAAGGGRLSGEPGLRGQGQRLRAGRPGGDDPRRRMRAQAARGLGHDARRHRLLPVGGGRDGRAGHDPYRHAERERVRGIDGGRHRGAHDPCLPHRGRGRRARARHHQGLRAAPCHPVLDQPDAALHGEHAGGASRHAHGVPPPRSRDPRGRGLRRIPHPQGDHRRRGHPARHGRVQHHRVRQPGDGTGRRGDHPHLADGRQDEAAARAAGGRDGGTTTTCARAATWRSTRSTRPWRMAWPTRSGAWRWASAPTSASGRPPSSG